MRYKFLEHTADVKFRAFGANLGSAFSNAALALVETMTKGKKIRALKKKKIKIEGRDLPSLLYNFLEEFLFLLDSEGFMISRIVKIKVDMKNFKLEAIVTGDGAKKYKISNDVKAVTYNDMLVEHKGKGWIAQVVLDV